MGCGLCSSSWPERIIEVVESVRIYSLFYRLNETSNVFELAIMVPQLVDVYYAVEDLKKTTDDLEGNYAQNSLFID